MIKFYDEEENKEEKDNEEQHEKEDDIMEISDFKDEMADDVLDLSIKHMNNMTNNVNKIYNKMEDMAVHYDNALKEVHVVIDEVKERQDSLDKNVVLTRGEVSKIKREVMDKSIAITTDFFKSQPPEEMFSKKRGHTIRYIWYSLKDKYNVSVYTEIPHIAYEEALKHVESLTVHDFPRAYYKLTPAMKELNENCEHVHFGEGREQEDEVWVD